jgi:prepilin-type N-terminal cleavage/methylation domain-containing protein
MKMLHRDEKGFTLLELLIVIAIVGVLAAVIIPNLGTFMGMGTVTAANSEAEGVKTAALAYYADVQDWPDDTASSVIVDSKTYSFMDYYAGKLKVKYYFDEHGFINGVSDLGESSADPSGECDAYDGIEWEPFEGGGGVASVEGHGQWVRK